jgi:hypothetical protein
MYTNRSRNVNINININVNIGELETGLQIRISELQMISFQSETGMEIGNFGGLVDFTLERN